MVSARRSTVRSLLPLLLAGAAGCAPQLVMIDGVAVPRPTIDYTGQAISVKHRNAHPRPGGPSEGLVADGGSIGGLVCGMQVDYDVTHKGDHIQLLGFIDESSRPSQLKIRQVGDDRVIQGNIVGLGVDVRFNAERISGFVGTRSFVVERDPQGADRYVGHIRVPGLYKRDELGDGAFPMAVDGREALLALPAADQGALLPTVLTCWWAVSENVPEPFHVGFGGAATALPPQSSSVYAPDLRIQNRPR